MSESDIKFFDSHAHYYDSRFYGEENPEGAEALLLRLFAENVCGVINIGTNPTTNREAIKQAKSFENMYAAVGLHPEDIARLDVTPEEQLSDLRSMLCNAEQRKRDKIVAIGEIGLDYYWTPYDKELQKSVFASQLSLARELDLPVIIHDREAHGDCFEMILKYPEVRGVFHSYSGSAEMARELVRRGWYISFSGVVTFKNALKAKEAAAVVPLERILIETDAPYLAPHPHRGKINHSGRLFYTAQQIAQIKGESLENIVKISEENAKRLFSI